jgi:hypothetical protein
LRFWQEFFHHGDTEDTEKTILIFSVLSVFSVSPW